MKYTPATPSAVDQPLLAEPEIGAEMGVYASYAPFGIVYGIQQTAVDAAASVSVAGVYTMPVAGCDLQLVTKNAVRSDVELVVTLDVVDEDDTATTAVATFAPPSYAADQSFNFQLATGVDFVPVTGSTKKIKSITGIASVAGGALGNKFDVVALPPEDSWFSIGCNRSEDLVTPYPNSLNIACGRDASAYVKSGRNVVGSLTVDAAYKTSGEGLARLGGAKVSVMMVSQRDDRIVAERTVIGGWRPQPQTPKGDGDDESVTSAEGMYEKVAFFY